MPDRLRDVSPRDLVVRRQIGSNARRARKRSGRTLRSVADEVGISDATLARIEHGKQVITTDILDRIARALDTTVIGLCRRAPRRAAAG